MAYSLQEVEIKITGTMKSSKSSIDRLQLRKIHLLVQSVSILRVLSPTELPCCNSKKALL